MRQRLTETSGDDLYPLDIHGKRVIDCHEQLVSILRNRLGRDHADFFAQPAPTAGSRSIVWYTPLAGAVSAVDALPPDEKQRLAQRAERILADVEGLASQSAADGPAGHTVGELLRAATQVAPGAHLFSVGGKAVTALWGHRAASAMGVQPPASRTQAAPVAHHAVNETAQAKASDPVVQAQRAENRTTQRTRWLAPTLVALAVVVLVTWAWQSDFLVRFAGPRDDLSAQIAAVEGRNRTLETRLTELKKNPAKLKCVPEPVPAPATQTPAKQSLHSPPDVRQASGVAFDMKDT